MNKVYKIILGSFFAIFLIVVLSCYLTVSINAKGKVFDNVQNIPYNEVGLLLGTSPVTPSGEHNYYFDEHARYSR